MISCGSVNLSLLVRPRCSRPPSDLQVKSCFCVSLLGNLQKPDNCSEEGPPGGFELETFPLAGTCLGFYFEMSLRSVSRFLTATLQFDHRPSWKVCTGDGIFGRIEVRTCAPRTGIPQDNCRIIIQVCGASFGLVKEARRALQSPRPFTHLCAHWP